MSEPIDVILFCPICHTQHIDQPEPGRCPPDVETATEKFDPAGYDPEECAGCGCPKSEHVGHWDNPPHKSHLCHGCGVVWRPADVPTNGVRAVGSRGGKDTWPTEQPQGEPK